MIFRVQPPCVFRACKCWIVDSDDVTAGWGSDWTSRSFREGGGLSAPTFDYVGSKSL